MEGGKEESNDLHGQYVPRAGCGLGYKHQRSTCDVYVMHIHDGVSPGVVTQCPASVGKIPRFNPSAAKRHCESYVLTSQCAGDIEDAPMEVCGAMEGGEEEREVQGSTRPISAVCGICVLTVFCMWVNGLTCLCLL